VKSGLLITPQPSPARFRPGRADQGIGDAAVVQNQGDDPARKGLAARLRDPVQRANGFQRALGG
jgi:hypothetical protein